MNVNNETGIIQDINNLCKITKNINKDIIFHSDICQGVGHLYYQQKCPCDVDNFEPDIVSFSMYKIGGSHMGIILSKHELNEDYYGTDDTENIQLSGFVIDEYLNNIDNNHIKMVNIKKRIQYKINEISDKLGMNIKDISCDNSISHIQSYLLPIGFEAKTIQNKLSELNIFVGTGSACSAQSNKGSHVIDALGYTKQSFNLIRFSYNSDITYEQVDYAISMLHNILYDLKDIVLHVDSSLNNQVIEPIIKNKKEILLHSIKEDTKEYIRLDLPLDLKSDKTAFKSIKISVGELYLKGNNKKKYEKKLLNNIIKKLKIEKSNLIIKENIIIIKNNVNNINEYTEIAGIAKITPCHIIYKNANDPSDINVVVSFISGIIENELESTEQVKFRMTIEYILIKEYHGMRTNDFVIKLGQYIRDRFGNKVIVDLKNYDININLNIYNNMVIVNTLSYIGTGGLPIGISGTGLLIIENNSNEDRNNLSMKMATKRGSTIDIINVNEINDEIISKYDYLIMEPKQYNDQNIYDHLKELEFKYSKPVVTLTNLINIDKVDEISNINVFTTEIKKTLMLLSGGIDSPVASHLLLKANHKVDFIHFTTEIDKIDNIIEIRNLLNKNSKIYVIDFREIQNDIVKTCDESYRTLMYKVFMILIANKYSENKYDYIATGNSLGQVASQTIENIKSTNLISKLPVISPLFGYNKDDIIKIAKSIGTYKPSICDGTNDCCVMYMPKHPIIRSNYEFVLNNIKKIDKSKIDNLNILEY